ncbi:MAG: glucans biosynthesis glucosyltransferase MdoH [Paracoccaceae bacterium]
MDGTMMDDMGLPAMRRVALSATPPENHRAMPIQSLAEAPPARPVANAARTWAARALVFGGAIAATLIGFEQMRLVFGNEVPTVLQGLLLGLFTVTFGWIALSALQALAGVLFGPRRHACRADAPIRLRTALLMPVYNEDPRTTCAALMSIGEGLARAGHGEQFEIFILSDTRDPDAWVAETAAFAELRAALEGRMRVWYRRRERNTAKKSGNLRDFVERWGGRYDAMLVLDADSLMSRQTILAMVRRMQQSPRLGILQTVPGLIGADSLFARLQQYASCLYGPVVARGVAAWQGLDGNYWGHNALIRVPAFAAHCGLPELPGRKPFGGHVLSHDFVEAALIRRGGWEVRMDPDLTGSWEGSPPSLLAVAVRDRRWAQGNLQHLNLLTTRGLAGSNRAHFLIGAGAYMMSPIWLCMIFVGMALTAQALLFEPQYFSDQNQLFPNWPTFDAERMGWLFAAAMTLLLLPKIVGIARALVFRGLRRRLGGARSVVSSSALEIVLSALYAPILMLIQARSVIEILIGRDSGWSNQAREGAAMPWREAFGRHWHHMLAGLVPALVLARLAPDQLLWLSPVLAGLVLAPALSRSSGDPAVGRWLRAHGLMLIPEESAPPPSLGRYERALARFEAMTLPDLARLGRDAEARARHVASLPRARRAPNRPVDLDALTAGAKIDAAASPEQALGWMTREERQALAGSPELLHRFGMLAGSHEAA